MFGSQGRVAAWWVVICGLVGLVAGGLAAWWLASWRGCHKATGRQVDWSAVEAIGTWVGGIGTVAALVFAARQFALDQDARSAQTAQRQRGEQEAFERALQDAQQVIVRVSTPVTAGSMFKKVEIAVVNGSDSAPAIKAKGSSTKDR